MNGMKKFLRVICNKEVFVGQESIYPEVGNILHTGRESF